MNEEIKEILECLKIALNSESYEVLLGYITNLQEQLHQASLDIQELTERDIECPSWCDKLTNLQQENERLNRQVVIMEKYLELIYDIGFDYDGRGTIEGLKKLIDDLVHCASLGRACNTTEPIYTNMGKYYNILHEEIEEKEEK